MIKPEMVPHGLALIARKAWAEGISPTNDDDWNAAIAAALSAWPGMLTERRARCDAVVLPYNLDTDLPQEASDAEAR